jgi:hypothetical protein
VGAEVDEDKLWNQLFCSQCLHIEAMADDALLACILATLPLEDQSCARGRLRAAQGGHAAGGFSWPLASDNECCDYKNDKEGLEPEENHFGLLDEVTPQSHLSLIYSLSARSLPELPPCLPRKPSSSNFRTSSMHN